MEIAKIIVIVAIFVVLLALIITLVIAHKLEHEESEKSRTWFILATILSALLFIFTNYIL